MNNKFLFKILEGQNIDNKYYLKSLLGTGGFGGVYLADEVVRDRFIRELAVKLIITDNPDKQLDELIFSTTLKQANLLDCYTCGECQLNNLDFLYLLMEKADYSLEDELKKGKLPEEEVKQLVLDITNGLDYLHSQKPVIVHRDLKPGNILRVGDKWKISDFGLVRSVQNNSTKTTTLMGSMGYAPPEAYQGKISSAWDMWSLGIIIYEALTGELPFKNDTPLALMQEVINQEPDLNIIPKNWQEIVNNCLKKDEKQRLIAKNLINNLQSNTAIKSNEDASNYYNRGKNYYELKQYEKAIIDYTKTIELDSNFTYAYHNRGIAYSKLKQYEKAIIDYTKAIELNPNYTSAYNNRGLAYDNLKQYEKAIIDYTKAIELDCNYANAYNNRGVTYQNLQQYKKAMIDYSKAIKLKPNLQIAINNKNAVEAKIKIHKKWFLF